MYKLLRCALLGIMLMAFPLASLADDSNAKKVAEKSSVSETKTFYMELTGQVNPTNGQIMVNMNLGKALGTRTGLSQQQLSKAASERRFLSLADAMNTLAFHGWRLVDTYTINVRNMTTVYWIAAKDVTDPVQLLEGLTE